MSTRAQITMTLFEGELRLLDQLGELIDVGLAREKESLLELAGDEDEGIENYMDEWHELGDSAELGSQLQVIGLYRLFELTVKRALHSRVSPGELAGAYRIKTLESLILRCTGRKLKSFDQYVSVWELRLLSNSIKHSGRVSKDLASSFPVRWKQGEQIRNLRDVYARLRPEVINLLDSMIPMLE